MSFISFEFLTLVVATFAIYYAIPQRHWQVYLLVAASLIFYAWDQLRLLPLLAAAVTVTYLAMLGSLRGSRTIATAGVIANLLLLCFFKYKFLVIPDPAGVVTSSELLNFFLRLPLPIGISFFVFHNISLIVDFFRKRATVETPSVADVVLYILFFPQLVSGPITRAQSFLPQIRKKYFRDIPWTQAAELLITGLFFKLFCANNLAQATSLMSPEHSAGLAGGDKLFLLFVYSFQIYADFFGYSTMALGLALLFGYRLPVNFRLPYIARTFSDFWNRWHISLSTWLRQYLYIPLGGNRQTPTRTYVNLMIVMFLGGLWHGAALSYAVWGVAHGGLLAIERFGDNLKDRYLPRWDPGWIANVLYCAFVFVCVSLCWLLFRFQDFHQASSYFNSILQNPTQVSRTDQWFFFALLYMSPVAIQHMAGLLPAHRPVPKGISGVFFAVLLWLAFTERGADTQFIYFRF